MKCPNCASDVPDGSNFCGVCGNDVREARAAAAHSPAQTIALDSSEEAQKLRAELDAATKQDAPTEQSTPDPGQTHIDAAPEPNPRLAATAIDMEAQGPESDPAPTVKSAPESDPAPTVKSAPDPEPESAPSPSQDTAKKADSPAPAINVSRAALNLADHKFEKPGTEQGVAVGSPEGMFRETQWFMKAQDPDHIDAIGDRVLSDLADGYEDKGEQFSTQVRQAFSLNPDGSSPTASSGPMETNTSSASLEQVSAPNSNQKVIAGVVIAIVGIAAAAYFL